MSHSRGQRRSSRDATARLSVRRLAFSMTPNSSALIHASWFTDSPWRNRQMRNAIVLFAAFWLAACATSGTKFEMSAVNAMQPGVTTYEEAVAKLGKPHGVTIAADGAKNVVWSWAQAGGFTGIQSDLRPCQPLESSSRLCRTRFSQLSIECR